MFLIAQQTQIGKQPDPNTIRESPSAVAEVIETAFTFSSSPIRHGSSTNDYIHINNYIPVGCLRIQKSDCPISSDVWQSCSSWRAFAHPRDVYNPNSGTYLLSAIQEKMFDSTILKHYRVLHNSGWIRMEFKSNTGHLGQARVYILPQDVGRGAIDRDQKSLRRSMQLLLAQIDVSETTWRGEWSEDTPVAHVDSWLDQKVKDDASLFYIYNTLPSPKPDAEVVANPYARDAMYRILDNDVQGLTTKMHSYQRRSAAMMLQREAQPAQVIDPRLRHVIDQRGGKWYSDIDAGSCFREPRLYETAQGGICAETMGLGKTLICLCLILATRDMPSQVPVEYSVGLIPIRKTTGSLKDMAAAALGRSGTPWKNDFARMEAEGYELSQCLEAIRKGAGYYYIPSPPPRRSSRNPYTAPPRKIWLSTATIVVVPDTLIEQWRAEIRKHTTGLKVLVMRNMKNALPPAEELADFDIVIFGKQRFDKEARDGSDDLGRRSSTASGYCQCPYIGNTRERHCTCFREEDAYHSPLKDIHFKRLITDEGHRYGNSSKSNQTEAATVVESLQLSARWVVSGTPTQGLYGAEVALADSSSSSISSTPLETDAEKPSNLSRLSEMQFSDTASMTSGEQEKEFYKQERKDLEKLGNIATVYLKARPWAPSEDGDTADWKQHVMQPRHGSKSRGNMNCLRATLEGMIIRHRPEDVMQDMTLPPLHQRVVYLEGSTQNKLSLNTFSMMIITNAVTSERKDADYFFHPRQRKSLLQLVSNLRQASFFWPGFEAGHVRNTIDNAKKFLEERKVPVTPEDKALLMEAIKMGEAVLANDISQSISTWHEMPMFIQNECPEDVRVAWSLDRNPRNPTLMGATMVHGAQKFVGSQLWKEDPTEGLVLAGQNTMDRQAAHLSQNPSPKDQPSKPPGKGSKSSKRPAEPAPILAGGVSVGESSNPKKRPRASVGESLQVQSNNRQPLPPQDSDTLNNFIAEIKDSQTKRKRDIDGQAATISNPKSAPKRKSALKNKEKVDVAGTLDPSSPLFSASIVSTASAKLSYLMDRIAHHQAEEKILVFYENENTAYYIAQALECLGFKHLIYAKTLSTARKSAYVTSFNQSEVFRVLLMDLSQAAFGLDMSSASRVYFVNPVFSPQVEAQAVKRAHRIGQVKPVFVETLVLKGSVEEVILDRRGDMSNEEHSKCKTILDDTAIKDWIRNVHFLPIPEQVPGPDQMAKLDNHQAVFGRGVGSGTVDAHDPDEDLVLDGLSPKAKGKRKAKGNCADDPTIDDEESGSSLDNNSREEHRASALDTDNEGDRSSSETWIL
jgi:hypothetical protein